MNFDKWHNSAYDGLEYNSNTYFSGQAAWHACKKEVLKIIEKNRWCKSNFPVDPRIIKEIKEL